MGVLVAGLCLHGCGPTLALDGGGRVICTGAECPDRDAIARLIAEPEIDHIVLVSDQSWSIVHPLHEHGQDDGGCVLERHLRRGGSVPQTPGRYRVVASGRTWSWRPTWTSGSRPFRRQPEVDGEIAAPGSSVG